MIIMLIALSLSFLGLTFISIGIFTDNVFMPMLGILLQGIALGMAAVCLIFALNNTEPSALDVYRGKTTLEITYSDSVAIDSIVVYKE